ncbi:MAG: MEDS domain-containing protein, partial [Candidatus Zixiibacteriota bacterium]
MERETRKLGIDILDDAPWGTHLCQFYRTKEDLVDILVPYFKAGLENNEFCMWVTSEPLPAEGARKSLGRAVRNLDYYLEKGQIEILEARQWYTESGKFDPDKVLNGWIEKEKRALRREYDGLRLTGNTLWLEKNDWRSFTDYERVVNNVIGNHRMIAICSYCLDKCGASELIDVIKNHQ